MADFKINGRMTVKNLKNQFKENFGATLRVYKGRHFADDDATLASLRSEGCKGGDFDCGDNDIVKDFEEFVKELYGITVQVALADDSRLSDNNSKLCEAGTK